MRSVTEFPNFKLFQGLKTKTDLSGEGKTAEETLSALGESFKMEGDKLKHFSNAVDVAGQNQDKLFRVLVVSLNEGEIIPPKAVKVEEHYYVPEFQKEIQPVKSKADIKPQRDGKRGDKKDGKGRN
jgi:hypothetical protein